MQTAAVFRRLQILYENAVSLRANRIDGGGSDYQRSGRSTRSRVSKNRRRFQRQQIRFVWGGVRHITASDASTGDACNAIDMLLAAFICAALDEIHTLRGTSYGPELPAPMASIR